MVAAALALMLAMSWGDTRHGCTVHIVTAKGVEDLPEMPKEQVAMALVERIADAEIVFGTRVTPGQLAAAGTASTAIPAFANVDPPRMFQFQARLIF